MADRKKRSRRRSKRVRKSHLGLYSVLAVVVLLASYVAVLVYSAPHVDGDRLRPDTFLQLLREKRIKDALVLDEDSVITGRYIRPDKSIHRYNAPYLKTSGSQSVLVDQLLRARVPTTIDQQFWKKLVLAATILIPSLIIIVVFVYLLLSYRRGSGLFGVKSGARKWDDDEKKVTFADVAGQETAIAELRELVGFLTDPGRFAELGALIPRGILLYGPPGCAGRGGGGGVLLDLRLGLRRDVRRRRGGAGPRALPRGARARAGDRLHRRARFGRPSPQRRCDGGVRGWRRA